MEVDPTVEVEPPSLRVISPSTAAHQPTRDRHEQTSEVRHHRQQDGGQPDTHKGGQQRLQDSRQVPEDFELTTEQIKRILTFGKDLQRLYDNIVSSGGTHDKLKVLLQVLCCHVM